MTPPNARIFGAFQTTVSHPQSPTAGTASVVAAAVRISTRRNALFCLHKSLRLVQIIFLARCINNGARIRHSVGVFVATAIIL
jgi:hypothetical protein